MFYFPAIGPGCGDLDGLGAGSLIEYHMVNDELYANVSCREGLYFEGTHLSKALLHCSSDVWDRDLRPCKGKSTSECSHEVGICTKREFHKSVVQTKIIYIRPIIAYCLIINPEDGGER